MLRNRVPLEMRVAPSLDDELEPGPPVRRAALLINPFYPKDPHASFGKHVLTPSLALTSIAGATPAEWEISYWDENLLQGPPPDQNLVDAKKKTPRPDDYARRVAILHDHGIQVNGSFVLGFDHDGPEVFERTVEWIERVRLECATFHILTPYPGTPLFRQMEQQGRLLHTDWERYDTGHVVFKPAKMTEQQLADGYAWCYRRLFGHRSIWRRRPADWRAVPAYLAMSYLYKRSNRFWHMLIRHNLTAAAWRPLVDWTRRRHVKFRRRMMADGGPARSAAVVAAGV